MIDIKKKNILRPLPKVSVSDGLKNPTIVGKASSPKASISKASSPKASSPKKPSAKASSPKTSIPEKVQKKNFILERYKIFMENRNKQMIMRIFNKQNKELLKHFSDSSSDNSK
jgi:hypothetical protein